MKILIATGGTGGHIFAGLAIAEEIKHFMASVTIVGSKFGMESALVPMNYKLLLTSQKPFLGKGLTKKLTFPFFLIVSFIESLYIIVKEKPMGVIGTGGFGSFSPVFLSALLGIPTIIIEVDSVPGLATKILSRFVAEVWLSFEVAKNKLPGSKIKLTGIPVRRSIKMVIKSLNDFGLTPGKPTILIFGGSRGASSINEVFSKTIPLLPDDFQFIWQTGKLNELNKLKEFKRVWTSEFIDDMGSAYGNSQLVISRAGALTIGELTTVGIPSILIPYPYATQNHQLLNAQFLENNGAAKVILDKDLTPSILANEIKSIIYNPVLRTRMAQAAKDLCTPDVAEKIAKRILSLCGET
ncbi:MAG: undecaprenyldiphospho-muramoylpentapeptide beta-N-acetylglucosaminyltransferase [bacterium]|nr:undecaprenyldiphospho-muramoylpentapeptide beta-N-acetylglucosaminyltransferase [bacterium]